MKSLIRDLPRTVFWFSSSMGLLFGAFEPDVIQTILAHLKQRAPPGAAHRQTPLQWAQNDLFAAT